MLGGSACSILLLFILVRCFVTMAELIVFLFAEMSARVTVLEFVGMFVV